MNPLERRTFAPGRTLTAVLAAGGVALSLGLSGCGAGQVAQTSTQEPAVNGTSGKVGEITLRNVHLRVDQSTDYVQPGRDAELIFVAANDSPDANDRLLSISSDIGEVALSGDGALPANGVLVVGTPDGQPTPLEDIEPADAADAKITLSKPITNGLTYPFTFRFEKSGEATLDVPISAGESPRREAEVEAGAPEGHAGGH